jgi:diguanylate cyclase (GGDEF)-like protein/PAS domain S-box-containing protein
VFEGGSGNLEFEIVGFKGAHRWLETHAVPLRDPGGKISALLAVTRDITERKQAEHALRIAATAFESLEGLLVTDADRRILQVNRAFTEMTGYAAEEIIGKTASFLKSGRQDDEFYRQMRERLDQSGYWQGEIWNRRKNGEIFPVWLAISAVKGPDGAVTNYVGASTDITEHKAAEDQIRSLAFFDPLTKLPNRRLLLDRLEHALANSQRYGHYGAVMFLDVDNFKALNDTQGHAIGDLLLAEVAQRLQASVREGDTVSRLGGDEFIIMLEGLSEDGAQAASQAEAVAEKIQDAIIRPYALRCGEDGRTKDFHCTASIGISLFLGHVEKVDELLKRADVAMYQAKSAGRNTVRFFDPDMQAALEARTAMESELRHALANGEFELHYQVQVDRQQRLIGAEVLLRWNNPGRGIVSPAAFIPLAEETGLIVPIGLWVLHSACVRLKAWSVDPARRDLKLAVNISPRQFRQSDFVSQVMDVLTQTGAVPSRLKLEMTEGLVLDNVEDTIEKMQALRALGIEFSMDDFGTGYSSLSYLKRLPLSELKIDRSFVHDLSTDANDATIVRTVITMGRTLGLDVIAEGVESEEQREFLYKNGCSAFQGYLFGHTVPNGEFEELLNWYTGAPSPAHLQA